MIYPRLINGLTFKIVDVGFEVIDPESGEKEVVTEEEVVVNQKQGVVWMTQDVYDSLKKQLGVGGFSDA